MFLSICVSKVSQCFSRSPAWIQRLGLLVVLELDQGLPERLQCFQDLKARFWFLRMFLKLFGFKWVPGVLGGFLKRIPGKS